MFPNTFRSDASPQAGHVDSASSVKRCWTSSSSPQLLQRYSYVGIVDSVSTRGLRVPAYHDVVLVEVAAVAVGYALGALPVAQVVGRRVGVDPTTSGSGNPGASNVYRTAGARAGVVVFGGDLLKGALATAVGWAADDRVLGLVCGLAAVLGHVAPVTRRFRGGKGVATAGGVLLVGFPVVAAVAAPLWALIAKATGKASLASIVAVVGAAAAVWLVGPPAHQLALVAAIVLVVVVRHASNIKRLVRGEERSIR